jgi:hypothetical protein
MAPNETYVVWAALQAMVNDIHQPQDQLSPRDWLIAEEMLARLDLEVNTRRAAPHQQGGDDGR